MSNMYLLLICVLSATPIFLSIKIIGFVKISKKDIVILTLTQIFISILLFGVFKKNELVMPVMLVITLLYYYLKHTSVLRMLFSFILAYIIGALVDTIQAYVLIEVLGNSKEYLVNNSFIYLVMNINIFIFSCLLACGVRYICKKLKLKISHIKNYKKATSIIFMNLSLLCLMFYCITLIVRYYNIDGSLIKFLTGICAIFFIINLGTSYYVIRNTQRDFEVKVMVDELNNLKLYTTSLENVNTEVRKFRHDYINIISAMDEYIENKNIEGLRNFFNNNLVPLNDSLNKKNLRLGLLGKLMIPELKSLVAFKVIRAQELGINIKIDITEEIHAINMDIVDLCRSVGIIIDNAIESAVEARNPEINIGVFNMAKTISIIVENNYDGAMPVLHEIVKNGYSTKGKNRGIGLHTLGEIIKKHRTVTLDTIIKENVFVQNMVVVK